MHFETLHGSAVPAKLIAEVRALAADSGASLRSCDRSPQAEAILRANGKKSQRQLRECFEAKVRTGVCPPHCGGDCNPANRPGRSTHERRNDGVAFPGPAGMRLRYWQVGMDWSDPAAVIAAGRKRDWLITVTYPDNPQESHHLNLRKEPKLHVVPTVRLGSSGPAVVRLTRRLSFITRPGPYVAAAQRKFSPPVEAAVRKYQADHHLTEDGIVGSVTWNQLAVSFRRERKRRREEQVRPATPMEGGGKARLKGPDVSKFQGDVDWRRVRRAGCQFTFVRVSDGDLRDPRFGPGRCDAVRKAGLLLGVYYYGRVASPDNRERDGRAEAQMVLGFAREGGWGRPGDLRLAYDFEETNKQSDAKAARHLMEFVDEYTRLAGHKPIIYTMPGFFTKISEHLTADDRKTLRSCPLWIAHWRVKRPTVPAPWKGYAVWQHTDKGQVAGIVGPCDMNLTRAGVDLEKLRLEK